MADTAPDKIDPQHPPKDAQNTFGGTWRYMGELYQMGTGVRITNNGDWKPPAETKTPDLLNPSTWVAPPTINPLALFGISNDEWRSILVRSGIIALGAGLIIAGLALFVAGSKAAATAVNVVKDVV